MKRLGLFTTTAAALGLLIIGQTAYPQGATTGAIAVTVVDDRGNPRVGARVSARHEPSGTRYEGRTQADGRTLLPGMRVGGPYTVTAAAIGTEPRSESNVMVRLGVTTSVRLELSDAAVQLGTVTVTAEQDAIFSTARTGAATSVSTEVIQTMPTITGRIEDLARLTPQYSGSGFGFSFAGQDNRMNNVTVDGSYFNNSFGLAGQPGDRTGVAPISLSAIEAIQINVAPYDVRQGHFIGAGVNTVTKSGTNDFTGSLHWSFRDARPSMHGRTARQLTVDPGAFEIAKKGISLGGPILPNRLFFYFNWEDDEFTAPGTTFLSNTGSQTVGGNITRVLASELDALRNFLGTSFGYEPGPYQAYSHETPAKRLLAKMDFNVNDRNKLTIRYNRLDSFTDVLASTSSSLGFGARRSNTTALNFQNSNYQILENIRSTVGEWNALIGDKYSNNLIVGYTENDESRASRGDFFPLVDILSANQTYTSFGFEPFTPNNELRYNSRQIQNNFTLHGLNHELTFGLSGEWYKSDNVFAPGTQSVYVYNSLEDFYTDANDYLANPSRTTSPVSLRRFQVRWVNQPGLEKPLQPLEVFYGGLYVQDQWQVMRNVRLTAGLRADRATFENTAFANPNADALTFRDENGNTVQYQTGKLPDASILWSPRLGFNWDVRGNRSTQIRGGTGVFTGTPAYVWISNQIGNTGVLTGFEELNNTTDRPFHPDPGHYYQPATGDPALSYELALTDPEFKFPQLWRSNIAADQRLPWGLIGTGEFIYNKDVNGIYYINANLPAAQSAFTGADDRPRWVGPSCGGIAPVSPCVTRLNNTLGNQVQNAIVLKNQNVGYSWNIAASLEKPFATGSFMKAFYSYGIAKNTVDPGSIAFGSWNNNPHPGDPNNPGIGFAGTSPGHRIAAVGSLRREWFRFGGTTMSIFWEGRTLGNVSYTYAGDLNGDGGTSNDLIYVPLNQSEMNFQTFCNTTGAPAGPCTNGGTTITALEQAAAWEAYIQQDEYLRTRRGRYAERNGFFLPMVYRADVSLMQEVRIANRNAFQIRLDILNAGNKIGPNWGVGQRVVNTQPLLVPTSAQGGPADALGRAQHRMRLVNNELLTKSLEQTAGLTDVYRIQLGVRYLFNQ
ncbi:MAG TPA: carboxypeptidase regulatory-like domain-containing protein [Gemmatimonadaceae bacterium]|nr:carboxypeptidase regulatory-like domain-containing protein [Gemmatimonadaceae bacterium]